MTGKLISKTRLLTLVIFLILSGSSFFSFAQKQLQEKEITPEMLKQKKNKNSYCVEVSFWKI